MLNLEGSYYDSWGDRTGTNPTVENSQVKGLVGYTYPIWEDATIGFQGFLDWMLNHDAYLIPSVRYSFTDELWVEVGSNVFLSKEPHTMFGALKRNNNVDLSIRHGF